MLRLYEVDPADIPTKGRVPKRSAYFVRNEITRRIYDTLRLHGTVSAVDIAAQTMRDKGLDPAADRKLRTNFSQRFRWLFFALVFTKVSQYGQFQVVVSAMLRLLKAVLQSKNLIERWLVV